MAFCDTKCVSGETLGVESRAGGILQYAKASVGIKDGAVAGKTAVKWFVRKIMELDGELAVIEN